jgi:hypothetical protein
VGEAVKLEEEPPRLGDFRQNRRTGGLGGQRSFAESAPAARDGMSTVARRGECASVKFRGSSPMMVGDLAIRAGSDSDSAGSRGLCDVE